MLYTKHIKEFTFGDAQYSVVDESGKTFILKVNYKDNDFQILGNENPTKNAVDEITQIANRLLAKKHNKNFAILAGNK